LVCYNIYIERGYNKLSPNTKNKKKGVDKRKKVCYNIYIEKRSRAVQTAKAQKIKWHAMYSRPAFFKGFKKFFHKELCNGG